MATSTESDKRLKSLDFLRLVLSLLVMVTHARRMFHIDVPVWLTKGPMDPKAGVFLFFVLSGYVLSQSLHKMPLSWEGYRNYIIKRTCRLFPPYWVALCMTFAILFLLKNYGSRALSGAPEFLSITDFGWCQWVLHVFLVVPGMRSDFAMPTVWSLMTEAKVSLLAFPFLGWALIRLPIWRALGLTVSLVFGSAFLNTYLIGTAAYLGLFAMGAILARVPYHCWQKVTERRLWPLILLAGLGFYSCMSARFCLPSIWLGYYLCGFGSVLIIATISRWPWMSRYIDSVQSRFGLDISYGIYLLHYPMLLAFESLRDESSSATPSRFLPALAAMLVTVVLAWVLACTVEKPMARLSKRLIAKQGQRNLSSVLRPELRGSSMKSVSPAIIHGFSSRKESITEGHR